MTQQFHSRVCTEEKLVHIPLKDLYKKGYDCIISNSQMLETTLMSNNR